MPKGLVWYAVYGSNLLKRRFLCYLEGRPPTERARTPDICKAGTRILGDVRCILPFELYFAGRESDAWGAGGVAYVGTRSDASVRTLGRAYLLTLPQFNHIAKWENGGKTPVDIPETSLRGDQTTLPGVRSYPVVLPCPPHQDIPVVTLTRELRNTDCNLPSPHYGGTMLLGLYESYPEMSSSDLLNYLKTAARHVPISPP